MLRIALWVCVILPVVYGRTVRIDVKAPWPVFPSAPIVEAAEYLVDLSPSAFWSFVDALCTPAIVQRIDGLVSESSQQTDQHLIASELQALVYETASAQVPPSLHNLMGTTIGLNAYAPTIEFYHSVSEATGGTPCVGGSNAYGIVYPGGQSICSLEDYVKLRANKFVSECISSKAPSQCKEEDPVQELSTSWDHVYASSGSSSSSSATVDGDKKHIVLYGTLGTSAFCQMHQAVKEDVESNDGIRYSMRHAFIGQTPVTEETTLPGYGIFLDIKNMEYNTANKDDVKEGDETTSKKNADPLADVVDGVDINGIYFSRLLQRRPKDKEELGILMEELDKVAQDKLGVGKHGAQMKVWKIKDLGVQTVQAIVSSANPAEKFAEYVHSFPSYATELSSIKLKASFVDSIGAWLNAGLGQFIPHNCLIVNGVRVDLGGSTFNVFDMLSTFKKELAQQSKLLSLGLSTVQQEKLVTAANQISSGGGASGGGGGGPPGSDTSVTEGIIRIDVSKGGKFVVIFLNNLEKDAQYKRWPKTLRSLLMPSWSLNSIGRNLYSLIFNIDPFTFDGINLIMQIQNMRAQQYPVRFGIVLVCSGSGSFPRTELCQLFAKAKEAHGVEVAFSFLLSLTTHVSDILQANSASGDLDLATTPYPEVPISELKKLYASTLKSTLSSWSSTTHASEAKIVLDKGEFIAFARNCTQYLLDRGLSANSFSLNGIVRSGSEISGLMQILGREQYVITSYYRRKLITDKTKSIFSTLLSLGRTYSRYHPLLEDAHVEYADALNSNVNMVRLLRETLFLESPGCINRVTDSASASASTKVGAAALRNTTLIILPTSQLGLKSAAAAVRWLAGDASGSCSQRLSLYFLAPSATPQHPTMQETHQNTEELDKIVSLVVSLHNVPGVRALSAIDAALGAIGDDEGQSWLASAALSAVQASAPFAASDSTAKNAVAASVVAGSTMQANLATAHSASTLAVRAAGWTPVNPHAEALVLHNARKLLVSFVGPQSQPLHPLDLDLLAGYEFSRSGSLLQTLVASSPASENGQHASDLLMRLSSFAGQYGSGTRRHDVHSVLDEAGFTASGDDRMAPAASAPFMFRTVPESGTSTSAGIEVYCIVDPLSLAGQRAASVLRLLTQRLQVSVTVILVPKTEYSDFPLKNFYRQVLVPHGTEGPSAVFQSLPHQHTLTVRPDAPEPWNIQAASAEDDTDNLRCTSTDTCRSKVTAVSYKLKNVLAAGQCFQVAIGGASQQPGPPKGLQLTLSAFDVSSGAPAETPAADTLVMQNLGYFQLLANPGLWRLDVAGGNFSILGPGTSTDPEPTISLPSTRFIAVKSFTDVVSRVLVSKKADGSEPVAKPTTVWGSLFGGKSGKNVATKSQQNDTIHVFSLATGHMYERLLRIMMLSVVKRSSLRVKFWLFENYLSPTFKNVAAAMADEYGFEVAYVTYKWPEWLTQQTEKQRIIWGYKILFLDVLFPLDVKKIIYVDADQVVRADLKELWDLDLQGKPYGYTPFCDSRQETLGFQFWRSGYWADHLRGKPYHISALYVVDLQRFREFSVGDQLRAVYDGLARDPNSLANLDQDLPNYAQHSVPIHSLPQEWLWCETWCSDKTKKTAKTIDLCNNPLHKEPKLDMAKRIIDGPLFNESWVELDKEITNLRIRKGFAFAD